MGYTPDLVVGVFIGYDTPKPMGKGNTGGQLAAPVFGSFMKMALADTPAVPFRVPPGIKLVRVNLRTGLRTGPEDPEAIMEAFKPDEEPDDPTSIIGFSEASAAAQSSAAGQGSSPDDAWQPTTTPQKRPTWRDLVAGVIGG